MNNVLHILHSVPDMNAGGLENFIMNIYRKIDRNVIQFDFLMHHSYDSFFDKEIQSLGGAIYRYPVVENYNLFGYLHFVNGLLTQHREIKVVHSHMCSTGFISLLAARQSDCSVRICHSHSTSHDSSLKGYGKWLLSRFSPIYANYLFACSTEAGRYLYGKRQFKIVRNAIDADRFTFNKDKREEIRKQLGIDRDDLVIGHVGRFTEAKNHPFIIHVFSKIKQIRSDSRLILVGDGEQKVKDEITNLIYRLDLQDSVILAGVHPNTQDYYSAFDVFLFPSLFEGLPLAGVEAQCEGLPCLFSNNITKELDITDFANFMSLDADVDIWASRAVQAAELNRNRTEGFEQISVAGYNAVDSAQELTSFYLRAAGVEQ